MAVPPYDDYRLVRMLAIVKSAFLVGFAIGGYRGGQRAALQFMAETQHALAGIRTRREAAAYWKLRHARTIVGATKEGVLRALQLTTVAAVFVVVRQLVDYWVWGRNERLELKDVGSDANGVNRLALLESLVPTSELRPYMSQVVAAATAGSMLALVAPTLQRLRYGLRGMTLGGVMALSLSVLQYTISSRNQLGKRENV